MPVGASFKEACAGVPRCSMLASILRPRVWPSVGDEAALPPNLSSDDETIETILVLH